MLRKAWYAVCTSDEMTESPSKVTVHEIDFVVYRDNEGEIHAFNSNCPHRGCDLSLGTVEGKDLICAFHGWHFNSEGRCTQIPANRSGAVVPAKAKLIHYPVCEKFGFIWIYTHSGEQSDNVSKIRTFAELESIGWTYVRFRKTWRAHFTRTVESVLDVSHLPFVHPETTGRNVIPFVDGPEYHVSTGGIRIFPKPFAAMHPMEPVQPPEGIEERTEIELLFPNQWIIRTPMGNENWMCTFLTFTPVTENETNIFGVIMRNFDLNSSFLDEFHIEHTAFVMGQDQVVIESIRPLMAPFDLQAEPHVTSDGPTTRYRVMLRTALETE